MAAAVPGRAGSELLIRTMRCKRDSDLDDEGGAAGGGPIKGRYAWATRNAEEWPRPPRLRLFGEDGRERIQRGIGLDRMAYEIDCKNAEFHLLARGCREPT